MPVGSVLERERVRPNLDLRHAHGVRVYVCRRNLGQCDKLLPHAELKSKLRTGKAARIPLPLGPRLERKLLYAC